MLYGRMKPIEIARTLEMSERLVNEYITISDGHRIVEKEVESCKLNRLLRQATYCRHFMKRLVLDIGGRVSADVSEHDGRGTTTRARRIARSMSRRFEPINP